MTDEGPDQRTAALAELGLMSASLLHELRDPVFALRAHVQLLRAKGVDLSDLARPLDDIDALLTFYGGMGRSGSEPLPVDLGLELRSAAPVLQAQARRRRVELELTVGEGSLGIVARPVAVRQILTNLVNNALDAVCEERSQHGESGAIGTAGKVCVHVLRDGDEVVLCVEDDGVGWPDDPRRRGRLTEPWVSTKGAGGSGLGLYLTRTLLEESGGRLVLATSEDDGARAEARFPAG